MATSEKGPLFIKSIDGTKEYKDKHFIADLFLKVIGEIGHQHVVQIITDNASVMKAAGSIVEAEYSHIFWSPCVVHSLNLALRNICAPKNSMQNEVAYNECNWIAQVADEVLYYQWIEEVRGRVAPHKNAKISGERNKCLKRFFHDLDDRKNVVVEFGLFSGMISYDDDNMNDRWTFDPILWWSNYGSKLPMLQTVALKLLGQPCSSSCAERNWSTYGFIYSMRRNRTTPKRAEDLVFVHSNLRFLSRKREEYTKGNFKKWDIGGDTWDEPFGGSGLLEIAHLTLDEPMMEISLGENDD
ncbi:uncharacterized protein LOC142639728 [Castanea sativa]|uniref:uncharacterized protein LOC142639728 n=1 Tax=Castanea sativa TaxID=21020 RepID=UPI003F64AF4D